MFTSENNWYSWSYGGVKFARQTGTLPFETHFASAKTPIGTFSDELKKAAASTLDSYPGLRPAIFFSGGVDSEVILRTYLAVGADPEVFIIRYENDINIRDVSHAVVICTQLGVKYNLVNFNLQQFYSNDAESIAELAQVDRPRALPQLKFMEFADGLPIYGASDLSIYRPIEDYGQPVEWQVACWEHDIGWSKYSLEISRPAIMEWYKWTPGLVLSYINTKWCSNLVADRYNGKLGTNSTKTSGYREVYPGLISRKKMTGFEGNIGSLVIEFEEYLKTKHKGFLYRNTCTRPVATLKKILLGRYL